MATLHRNECKVGMIVMLTDPDPGYNIGEHNPKVGSDWECEGTIVDVHGGEIDVAWENGFSNTYKDNELSLSQIGICVDFWNEI